MASAHVVSTSRSCYQQQNDPRRTPNRSLPSARPPPSGRYNGACDSVPVPGCGGRLSSHPRRYRGSLGQGNSRGKPLDTNRGAPSAEEGKMKEQAANEIIARV